MEQKKKIPLRQCVGCAERKPKSELLRVVRTPEGEIVLDKTGKKSYNILDIKARMRRSTRPPLIREASVGARGQAARRNTSRSFAPNCPRHSRRQRMPTVITADTCTGVTEESPRGLTRSRGGTARNSPLGQAVPRAFLYQK